ncbi:hypothetical protein SUGI_0300480 [Cryptomeria japonica]|uniref:uncharacterized protein LOC131074918 n=1 Tax=Cryptomeria japonica TaxID=3369 RepID=UPI002408E1E0|nr:uncharacterized protein LOC131074918 [Cryptomeria japonica]GLJ17305.1 hypothetical protein SUGI_0300480 [Cryptomeria japonica]
MHGDQTQSNNNGSSITFSKRRRKQLIFHRRYGWIYEEWRSPAEVALTGGRGMFCIVPLTKAAVKVVFQWVNTTTDLLMQKLESPSCPRSPQAWFNCAKETVRCKVQNWCGGWASLRRKPFLIDSSQLKAFNLSSIQTKYSVKPQLQSEVLHKGEINMNNER